RRCPLLALSRTFVVAPHTSAFGGKADMTLCGCPLSWSLLGVKRTCSVALHMSANDPKRTCCTPEPLQDAPHSNCNVVACFDRIRTFHRPPVVPLRVCLLQVSSLVLIRGRRT